MSEIMQITGLSELISDIAKTFSCDAVTADMLISSYKSVYSDPELSDNEKRYFANALGDMLDVLDQVRNPQIFDSGKKRTVKLFFCPAERRVPQALKDGEIEKEDVFYKKMSVICPDIFKSSTHFEKLVSLYQCGCPSRITDAYTDPFTALYAALASGGGSIAVLAVPEEVLSYPDSDRALMLSCLPKLTFAKKRELLEIAYASLASTRFQQLKGGSRYLDEAPEELYKEITTEKPYFRRDIDPADLLKPLFVKPCGETDKTYILHGLCLSEKDAAERIKALTVKEYTVSDIPAALEELSLIGFDGQRLCRDAKDAAEYLKNNV